MKDLFYIDEQKKEFILWDEFIEQINITKTYNKFCFHPDYFSVFKHIAISIIYNKPIVLLDSDFSDYEINNLTGEKDITKFEERVKNKNIKNKDELLKILREGAKENWGMTLYTSGTTGIPKNVTHNYTSITRNAKISEKHKNDVWGFAYNPTHMAGIQVFFQAILNGNPIIKLFGLEPNLIFNSINKYSVSHISATPTFYKIFLSSKQEFPKVKVLTAGGERFDENLFQQLRKIFPNAKLKNIYALTETGSLFSSDGDIFTIQNLDLVKIENNHLLIHSSLLGNFMYDGDWYDTGDLVQIIKENPLKIKFITREKDLINVGGYKVNPHEVEYILLQIKQVKDAVVYSRINSIIGNVIVADVVLSEPISEKEIRKFLSNKIQEYKIPRFIRFVEKIEVSRTGKKKRI